MDPQQLPQPNFNQPQGQPSPGPFYPGQQQPQHGDPVVPQPWQPGQQPSPGQFTDQPAEQPFATTYQPRPGWTVPQPPVVPEPPRPTQQFGGALPELPQLANEGITPSSIYQVPEPQLQQQPGPQMQPMQSQFQPQPMQRPLPLQPPIQPVAPIPLRQKNSSSRRMLITIPLLLLVMLGIFWGAYSLVSHFTHKSAQPVAQQPSTTQASITAADKTLASMGSAGQLKASDVSQLDKTSAFFAAFENASQQAKVGVISDVYYTAKQADSRPQQYTLYQASTNYQGKDKVYAFAQDTYGSLSVSRQRCQNGTLYTYSVDGSGKTAWVKSASSKGACDLSAIKTNINDGLNAGGLSEKQAQAFASALITSRVVSVDALKTVTVGGKQYLRFDVSVNAKWQNKQSMGMQAFADAFSKTGLSATSYPYAYFGTGAQGAKIAYYIDASTRLPVYSQMVTSAAVDSKGVAIAAQSYEHQSVEYTYGDKGIAASPDAAIAFKNWPAY